MRLDCVMPQMPKSIALMVMFFVEWPPYGSMPAPYDIGDGRPVNRGHVGGRAVIDRQTIHIHDITAEFDTEFPQGKELQERTGARTILATPLTARRCSHWGYS